MNYARKRQVHDNNKISISAPQCIAIIAVHRRCDVFGAIFQPLVGNRYTV